ncbi:hypothetical protein [Variovorax sp. Sphag1AA]|uniref:hypothetical protein n=1 Tax=Variovorax sp. Sphag1AA TaxID=2587027 RepID=UPI001611CC4A|nr:hypothetical protein [Variovorax sp. Sphag1AA]MBB3181221.1 hypothetical protein [Variovorax sp. Sphag1AA]
MAAPRQLASLHWRGPSTLSKKVESRRDPEGDNSDLALFVAARHFGKEPHRSHAAISRMGALSRLMKSRSLEPWVTPSAEGGDSVMVSRAALEAAARCELIDVHGEAGFDYRKFMALCAEYGATEAMAPT